LSPGIATKKRLLIVDDDLDLAEATSLLLSGSYTVDLAADGEEALQRLANGARYDLILLDLVMPRMDGSAVVRTLRGRGAVPPILLVSGSDDLAERATELGIDAFLAKPVDADTLRARIAGLLARHAA
jgi:DNA-binding response OmpR family regulator